MPRCLLPRQLTDVNILEPQLVAVVLQFDLAGGEDRLRAIPIIFHRGVVQHHLAVEENVNLLADHHDE